ncbi:MAG: catalase-related domain-containing protein [Streptosporangiaceae bacterium]
MFYRSLTPLEQAHIVEAFTFELGKCYEQAIKERELRVLADVDADLCAQVAAGLGLPAPTGSPAQEVTLSPALSQVVTVPWPIAGRKIGVVADAGSDLAGVDKLRKAAARLGATVLVIAPAGGVLRHGARRETVERTLLTTRSVEFDALVIAGGTTPSGDIKLTLLLQEAFRHCKTLGAWGDGAKILVAAGISPADPGIVTADAAVKAFHGELFAAMGLHRAWARAADVIASGLRRAAGLRRLTGPPGRPTPIKPTRARRRPAHPGTLAAGPAAGTPTSSPVSAS